MHTRESLITFEENIARLYEDGAIRAPVHLRDGNEDNLIEIFKDINHEDYVFSTWASHLHALLKGVPQERIVSEILQGRSISLNFPDYNFYSSAIVGGTPPIATGIAYALKQQQKTSRVYCFIGDMGFHTGIFYESFKYAVGHDLPITFIVEDNNKSVGTPTVCTWHLQTQDCLKIMRQLLNTRINSQVKLNYYCYDSEYPHSGTGSFVEF